MNTLIFNGSPRQGGDTAYLLAELAANLKGNTKICNAYSAKISPCTDCRYCWQNASCCIDDEMQQVYEDIKHADFIVIASPLYFSELTAPLLGVFSRLQMLYASKRFLKVAQIEKPKQGALVLCGGGNGGPDRAIATAKTIFSLMHAVPQREVFSLQTDKIPSCEDSIAIAKINQLAEYANSL